MFVLMVLDLRDVTMGSGRHEGTLEN